MIRIFTSFFDVQDAQRRGELIECLRRNLDLPEVGNVCLLLEGTVAPLEHPKLLTRNINTRPNYQDFFQWANELAGDADFTVVCNSDICFDSGLANLTEWMTPDHCAAMARWQMNEDGSTKLFYRNDSQDTWVFRGPIRNVVSDYPVGVARCDNRILYELRQAGYQVINPSFSIRSYHLHAGELDEYHRRDPNFVERPYSYLWPHNLKGPFATLIHNVLHPNRRLGWRIDSKKVETFLPVRVARRVIRLLTGPPQKEATTA